MGRNYVNHTKELNNQVPTQPLFFLKPDSCILKNNKPFYLPDFSKNIHHEVEIVIKICRLGKHIKPKFTYRYYKEVGLGIDFTARDLQDKQRAEGKPWEISKVFDGAAPISKFISLKDLPNPKAINFHLDINGRTIQQGNSKDLIFQVDDLIAYISRFMTLKMGDLLFTGTPAGVGPVHINDHLEAYLEGIKMLDFRVK